MQKRGMLSAIAVAAALIFGMGSATVTLAGDPPPQGEKKEKKGTGGKLFENEKKEEKGKKGGN